MSRTARTWNALPTLSLALEESATSSSSDADSDYPCARPKVGRGVAAGAAEQAAIRRKIFRAAPQGSWTRPCKPSLSLAFPSTMPQDATTLPATKGDDLSLRHEDLEVRTWNALPTLSFEGGESDTCESSDADSQSTCASENSCAHQEAPHEVAASGNVLALPKQNGFRRKFHAATAPTLTEPCEPSPSFAPLPTEAEDTTPPAMNSDDATIVFDWDDTLFPTWYVCEVVMACMPGEPIMGGAPLDPDSPFYESLAAHAQLMESMLRTARGLGHVAIVTLGHSPWVLQSAAKWLPMIDFRALFEELDIQVIYARDCIKQRHIAMSKHAEGVNLYTIAKKLGMGKVIRRHRKRGGFAGNVICIGDSQFEHDAVKDLLWGMAEELPNADPSCKTVRFMTDPSLKELGLQLGCLSEFLGKMVARADDFDVSLGEDHQPIV